MSAPLRYVLVADGSSDRALIHVIEWLLQDAGCPAFEGDIPDLRRLSRKPRNLAERIQRAIELGGEPDLVFVHRDAEGMPLRDRLAEIRAAVVAAGELASRVVPLVPVRMTEAWLLCDVVAIRRAAANPNGRAELSLPKHPDTVPDPKGLLHELLKTASEHKGRRLKKLGRHLPKSVQRVAEQIRDFSPLRQQEAFREFEAEVRAALEESKGRSGQVEGGSSP